MHVITSAVVCRFDDPRIDAMKEITYPITWGASLHAVLVHTDNASVATDHKDEE